MWVLLSSVARRSAEEGRAIGLLRFLTIERMQQVQQLTHRRVDGLSAVARASDTATLPLQDVKCSRRVPLESPIC